MARAGIPDRVSQLLPSDVDRSILEAVRSLEYGSVEVVVHDSQVVQIERREKVRLGKPQASPPAPRDSRPDKLPASPDTPRDPRPVDSRRPRQVDTGPSPR
jgi:hypothetical protein